MSRTYLITGAASGIGKATSELLQSRGHKVIGADLQNADINGDLSTPEGRQNLIDEATKLSDGRLDGVIANAGIQFPKPITLKVNYFGALATLEGLRPLLLKSDAPRAALTCSIASLHPQDEELMKALEDRNEEAAVKRGTELEEMGQSDAYKNYSCSKKAIAKWMRRAAPSEDWAGAGIPLNAIAPAVVTSPMTKDLVNNPEGRKLLEETTPMPLNGWMDPEQAAKLFAWLVSEENTHLCGQVIFIDGGYDALTRGDSTW